LLKMRTFVLFRKPMGGAAGREKRTNERKKASQFESWIEREREQRSCERERALTSEARNEDKSLRFGLLRKGICRNEINALDQQESNYEGGSRRERERNSLHGRSGRWFLHGGR